MNSQKENKQINKKGSRINRILFFMMAFALLGALEGALAIFFEGTWLHLIFTLVGVLILFKFVGLDLFRNR